MLIATEFGWNAETVSAVGAVLAAAALIPAFIAAAFTANGFRLEASPYIVVEGGGEIRRLAIASGQALRYYEYEVHSTEDGTDNILFATPSMMRMNSRAFPNIPTVAVDDEFGRSMEPPTAFIAVRNVGRSPAIRLWLDGHLECRANGGEWKQAVNITFVIDALPPGEVLIRLRNYSSVTLKFAIYKAAHDPRQRKPGQRVNMRKKQQLNLASLEGFYVKADRSGPRSL